MLRDLDLEMALKMVLKSKFHSVFILQCYKNLFSRVSDIPSTFQYQLHDAPLENAINMV